MKFGEAGTKMVDEMIRSKDWNFDETLIERVTEENLTLDQNMEDIKLLAENNEIDEALSINYMVLKNFKERNLRIMRAYKFKYILKIQSSCFSPNTEDIKSSRYVEIAKKIRHLVDGRNEEFDFLVFSKSDPPLNMYVRILTLRDCGVVMDGDSFIELKKNRIYYLKTQNVEHLIHSKGVKLLS